MGPAPQEKAQEMRQQALREAAKLKILQEEEAQRWIFELIFKPKRKSDLKKVFKAVILEKNHVKISFFDHSFPRFFVDESWSTSLGLATLQSKLYAKQLEAENATWRETPEGYPRCFAGGIGHGRCWAAIRILQKEANIWI